MQFYIKSMTYGPIKKHTDPIDNKYLYSYIDIHGQTWVGLSMDIEKQAWLEKMIQEIGLEELCRRYPYQPLRVDTESGELVPIKECNYFAKLTNCFHVMYHIKLDKIEQQQQSIQMRDTLISAFQNNNMILSVPNMNEQQFYQYMSTQPYQPNLAPQSNQTIITNPQFEEQIRRENEIYMTSSIPTLTQNCIRDPDPINTQDAVISPHLETGYHENTPEEKYHEIDISNYVESEDDKKKKKLYGFTNKEGSMLPKNGLNDVRQWHPNMEASYSGLSSGLSSYIQNPYAVNLMSSQSGNTSTQNPFSYNPSYLPQYKEIDYPFINVRVEPLDISPSLEDIARKAADRDRANFEYIKKYRLDSATLDTDDTGIVDFSDPESVARLQGIYGSKSPYEGSVSNPNKRYDNNPYGFNNPYGNNKSDSNHSYIGGIYWQADSDLSFMAYSKEEIEAGKDIKVVLVRGAQEEVVSTFVAKPKKTEIKVELVRKHIVEIDNKTIELEEDEYQLYIEQKKKQDEIDNHFNEILKEMPIEWAKPTRYIANYRNAVKKLAYELSVYDEARSLCLLGSLDNLNVSKNDFRMYFEISQEKLIWYRIEEEKNPNINYRTPYRNRPLPEMNKNPYNDEVSYTLFKPGPKKYKSTTISSGDIVLEYEYDRGREPNIEEWKIFYAQAEYERDKEIKIRQQQLKQEREKEDAELEEIDMRDPMSSRLYQLKMHERLMRNQYNVFRDAYGTSITKEQFDEWWNMYTPPAQRDNTTGTKTETLEQRAQWRREMGLRHLNALTTFVPIDVEAVRNQRIHYIRQVIREFDRGVNDNCSSLREFFDNLGYLNVRISEQHVEEQREAEQKMRLTINKDKYFKNLAKMREGVSWDKDKLPNSTYINQTTYEEFCSTEQYQKNRAAFFDYCKNSKGHISLQAIYR